MKSKDQTLLEEAYLRICEWKGSKESHLFKFGNQYYVGLFTVGEGSYGGRVLGLTRVEAGPFSAEDLQSGLHPRIKQFSPVQRKQALDGEVEDLTRNTRAQMEVKEYAQTPADVENAAKGKLNRMTDAANKRLSDDLYQGFEEYR